VGYCGQIVHTTGNSPEASHTSMCYHDIFQASNQAANYYTEIFNIPMKANSLVTLQGNRWFQTSVGCSW
jgi:hypothetical protein